MTDQVRIVIAFSRYIYFTRQKKSFDTQQYYFYFNPVAFLLTHLPRVLCFLSLSTITFLAVKLPCLHLPLCTITRFFWNKFAVIKVAKYTEFYLSSFLYWKYTSSESEENDDGIASKISFDIFCPQYNNMFLACFPHQ